MSIRTFTYKRPPQGDLRLHVHLPARHFAPPRPAIVFFFGGGWHGGTVEHFRPQAEHFALGGLVAVRAEYRVASRHGVTPDVCVRDARSALRWVRAHAAKLEVDPARIVGSGGSAGAHLAACAALLEGLDAPEDDRSVSPRPDALVLFNPVLNFCETKFASAVDDATARAITPTHHVRAGAPPALLLFGSEDPWLCGAEQFVAASREAGNRVELDIAEGQGHGFFNNSPWRHRTLARAGSFLASLGYLVPEPQSPSRQK